MGKVIVAMSGGVDSSTTALQMMEAGHEVIGVTLWMQESPSVPSQRSLELAQKTTEQLGIEHHILDARQDFAERVVQYFAREYAQGRTPNPCVMCNPTIKFKYLLEACDRFGASKLVTGHYAKKIYDSQGRARLVRPEDRSRDQSYFLYRLSPAELDRVEFPLAAQHKDEVRELAGNLELPSAQEPDSMDICFVSDKTRVDLVAQYYPQALEPGDIVLKSGERLGTHPGLAHFTVGKRKGLGIAYCEPLYVLKLDAQSNTIVVGTRPELQRNEVYLRDPVFHEELPQTDERFLVQYRSSSAPVFASVERLEDEDLLRLRFTEPVCALAPGQAAVWYRGDMVCGGATIEDVCGFKGM